MHKKLAASLTIAIFIIGTLAIMVPVQAHYTLGNSTNTSPYHVNDFDPHVYGAIGYVWPGGGESATGLSYVNNIPPGLSPGYIAPWADSPNLHPAGSSSYTWYQLAGSAYAPFGAILVNSTGDLIFAVNASSLDDSWKPVTATGTSADNWGWGVLDILIPPGFGGIKAEQVVTTITNDYSAISVSTLDPYDRYAPGWTLVRVKADGATNAAVNDWLFNSTLPNQSDQTYDSTPQWYYVRINGVTAPAMAGKYFFKMFLGGVGPSGVCATGCQPDYWLPTQNWPVMLVKGEINPSIAWGNIYYGGYNATLYGNSVEEAGMVWAHMTTRLDPATGNALTGYPLIDAQGYFNATAQGHYEVEGLAPGVYDFYASAAGFPQQLIASGVHVLEGQSLNLNGYLQPGVVIHGTVYSKHGFGEQPWPTTTATLANGLTAPEPLADYIKIEIYNAPTVSQTASEQLAPGITPLVWSPLPCIAAGPGATYMGGSTFDATNCGGDATYSTQVAFPWHEYSTIPYGTHQQDDVKVADPTSTTGYDTVTTYNSVGHYPKPPVDEQGVGPAQSWTVAGGTTTPFTFQMGVKGEYGVPTTLSGMVPQMNATWVGGLTAGRYYARAWVQQYVQTELDGVTFHEVYFDVAANEWAGDIAVPIDLHLADFVVKTVHFHDTAGTIVDQEVSTGATYVDGGLYDPSGVLWAWSSTGPGSVTSTSTTATLAWFGFQNRWDGRNYGIPSGTYTPMVYAQGYVQQTFEQVSVSLSGTPVYISDHLYRGVGFNITIYSTDFEQPRVSRNWVWGSLPGPLNEIGVVIYNEPNHTVSDAEHSFSKQILGTDHSAPGVFWGGSGTSDGYYLGMSVNGGEIDIFTASTVPSPVTPGHFESGQYSFRGYTYGYVQKKTFEIYALKGEIADIKINLVIGVNVTLDVPFKKEGVLTPTDGNMSARVRVFDDSGMLVGAWMSSEGLRSSGGVATNYNASNVIPGTWKEGTPLNYVPGGTTSLHLTIAGLPSEFGDPVFDKSHFRAGDDAFLNFGIDGSPNYQGGYSVEVDFVKWYSNDTYTLPWPSSAFTPGAGTNTPPYPVFYPPTAGLLLGESFHTVPGHPQNPFGWTEVGALSTTYVGHSMAPNHLGPYAQEGVWSLPNGHLSGEVSGIWEVDLRGFLSGTIVGFTWSGEFRTVSWATVSLVGADGFTYNSYAYDGWYEMFANPGTYKMTIAMPGYTSLTLPMSIATGQTSFAGNLFLQESGIPIPEFTGIAVVAFSALAASLYLLRRRRH